MEALHQRPRWPLSRGITYGRPGRAALQQAGSL